jgi:hypothetical protein
MIIIKKILLGGATVLMLSSCSTASPAVKRDLFGLSPGMVISDAWPIMDHLIKQKGVSLDKDFGMSMDPGWDHRDMSRPIESLEYMFYETVTCKEITAKVSEIYQVTLNADPQGKSVNPDISLIGVLDSHTILKFHCGNLSPISGGDLAEGVSIGPNLYGKSSPIHLGQDNSFSTIDIEGK